MRELRATDHAYTRKGFAWKRQKLKLMIRLISLGLDSLIGMNLRSKLEVALQTDLPNFGLKYEATVSGLAAGSCRVH